VAWLRLPKGGGAKAAIVHSDAFGLAAAVLKRVEASKAAQEVLAFGLTRPDGALHFTTHEHFRAQNALGKTHCTGCGFFFARGRAFKEHQLSMSSAGTKCGGDASAREWFVIDPPALEEWVQTSTKTPRSRTSSSEQLLQPVVKRKDRKNIGTNLATPLAAARDGDLAELKRLALESSLGAVAQAKDRNGGGLLHWAAGGGHLETCKVSA